MTCSVYRLEKDRRSKYNDGRSGEMNKVIAHLEDISNIFAIALHTLQLRNIVLIYNIHRYNFPFYFLYSTLEINLS